MQIPSSPITPPPGGNRPSMPPGTRPVAPTGAVAPVVPSQPPKPVENTNEEKGTSTLKRVAVGLFMGGGMGIAAGVAGLVAFGPLGGILGLLMGLLGGGLLGWGAAAEGRPGPRKKEEDTQPPPPMEMGSAQTSMPFVEQAPPPILPAQPDPNAPPIEQPIEERVF